MHDWESTLQNEFKGKPGSFLIQLRYDNHWDADAFNRLLAAMKACCIATSSDETLARWIADGFWEIQYSVLQWSQNSNSPLRSDRYHSAANELLHDLAYWYFRGESPAGPDTDPDLITLALPD